MTDYVKEKSIIVTGAASGFGKLISEKASRRGAYVTCADINGDALDSVVEGIRSKGGKAQAVKVDVANIDQMKSLASAAIESYNKIDVMVNNAGVMPLAFFSDHKEALPKWHQCIDINIKGVLNGMVAVYDQMQVQGRGHIINISSIYGNYPVVGSAVYQATKTAVNFLSESLRIEARGKIKVTIVKPTGVAGTGLAQGVVNPQATVGIVGHNVQDYASMTQQMSEGNIEPEWLDPMSTHYSVMDPEYIADQVIYAINQPWGLSIGDITVRTTGDICIL